MALLRPRLVNQGASNLAAYPSRIKIPQASYSYGVAVGSLLTATGAPHVGGHEHFAYWVNALYGPDNKQCSQQYLDTTELAAEDHWADVIDVSSTSGVEMEIGANAAITTWATNCYVTLTVAAPATIDADDNPFAHALPSIVINGGSESSSSSNMTAQIVRASNVVEPTGATLLNYVIKAIA